MEVIAFGHNLKVDENDLRNGVMKTLSKSQRKKLAKSRSLSTLLNMIVATWNIRGLNSPLKQKKIKYLIKPNKISIIGILETK